MHHPRVLSLKVISSKNRNREANNRTLTPPETSDLAETKVLASLVKLGKQKELPAVIYNPKSPNPVTLGCSHASECVGVRCDDFYENPYIN